MNTSEGHGVGFCPKTISGNHLWDEPGLSWWYIKYVRKCLACGMIDDRDLDVEPKREEK